MPDAPTPIHVRAQVRDAAAIQLAGACGAVAGRVFTGRARPLTEDELPCLLVYTPSETVSAQTVGRGAIQDRRIVLQVVAVATAEDDVSAALDSLATAVEQALLAPGAMSPACRQVSLDGTTHEYDASAADMPMGRAVISFSVSAYTTVGSPTESR